MTTEGRPMTDIDQTTGRYDADDVLDVLNATRAHRDALAARLAKAEAQRDANFLECAQEFRRAAEAACNEAIGRYKHEARALTARLAEAEAQRDEARRTDLAEYVYNTTPQAAVREAHRERRYWEGQCDKAIASRNALAELLKEAGEVLEVAYRLIDYFSLDRPNFVGSGTPSTCLESIRAILAKIEAIGSERDDAIVGRLAEAEEREREACAKAVEHSLCDVAEAEDLFMAHRDYFAARIRARTQEPT
jgi:hypothetical protein